jgi:hypothetical protein
MVVGMIRCSIEATSEEGGAAAPRGTASSEAVAGEGDSAAVSGSVGLDETERGP